MIVPIVRPWIVAGGMRVQARVEVFAFELGAAGEFAVAEHGAAALDGAAVAVGGGVVGVVEVVLVGELFAGGDVAEGDDEDAAVFIFGLAVGVAGVVDEHGGAEAVDDGAVLSGAEEVGDEAVARSVRRRRLWGSAGLRTRRRGCLCGWGGWCSSRRRGWRRNE